MRPSDAAVMPFPSEEVTPPVTNTNFGTGADLRGFSNDTGALVEAEWERMKDDQTRAIGAAGRRELGHLDRLLDAAVVESRVEAQGPEPRIDQHAAFDRLMLDDRDERRPQPHHARPQGEWPEERRSIRTERMGRALDPTAQERRHVGLAREGERAVVVRPAAEERARAASLVEDEAAE